MNIDALQSYFVARFQTRQVRVSENDSVVTIAPVEEKKGDCALGLRGMFADCPEMSVDKFLERKRSDKGLEL
jgi:virulence-associated protein VagC